MPGLVRPVPVIVRGVGPPIRPARSMTRWRACWAVHGPSGYRAVPDTSHLRVTRRRGQASTVPGVTSRPPRSAVGSTRARAARIARSAQSGPGHLPAQHHHLMPQHQDLRIPRRPATAQQDQPAEHPHHHQIQQTDRHEPRSCPIRPPRPNRSSDPASKSSEAGQARYAGAPDAQPGQPRSCRAVRPGAAGPNAPPATGEDQ